MNNDAAKAAIARWEFDHIGAAVESVNRTADLLAPLGIGPFITHTHGELVDREFRGKPANSKNNVVVAQDSVGDSVEFELIEPLWPVRPPSAGHVLFRSRRVFQHDTG